MQIIIISVTNVQIMIGLCTKVVATDLPLGTRKKTKSTSKTSRISFKETSYPEVEKDRPI